ncbi:hypothetical protein FOA52_012914 [Chlamydomonas sp. UWO 241]|nr:hypothetical protein FOA52_012914 [Chlamydomonas sp. UWO 241]
MAAPTEGGHPLEHKWTLWFDNPTTKQTTHKYGQSLRSVYTFDTVEDFWCLYNNIRTPGQLQPTATFYLFKSDIEPKWEDPKCANGGCWAASANKGPNQKSQLDTWWMNVVLACIGEQFSDHGEVCGIAVNIRPKGDRVELWTKTASNEAAQTIIGRQLKQFLEIADTMRIGYSVFSEKLAAGNKAKDRYTV